MADLDKSEHQLILKSKIIPARTAGLRSCEAPQAIILAGQPGAGKSGLAMKSITANSFKQNHIKIDIDELRIAHPKYEQLRFTQPKNAAAAVQKDASQWGKELRNHCIENNYNLVIDGTLGNQHNANKLVNQLKENGYSVEIHVMAIDKDRSDQGIYSRFENRLPEGKARWVEPDTIAEKAYTGMSLSLSVIEKNHPDVTMKFYGTRINGNDERITKDLNKPDGLSARRTLDVERKREWSAAEKDNYVNTSNIVIRKMIYRNADTHELEKAEATLQGSRYLSCEKDLKSSKEVKHDKNLEGRIKQEHKGARVYQARSGTYSGRITHITENEVVQQVKTRDFYVHGIDKGEHNLKVNNEVTITNRQGKTLIKNHSLAKNQDKKHGMTNTSKSPSEKSRGL